jgi:hypothetical protein
MSAPVLSVEVASENQKIKDLCIQFWDWNDGFIQEIDTLVERFEMSRQEIYATLKNVCKVHAPCRECNKPVWFFQKRPEVRSFCRLYDEWLCNPCRVTFRRGDLGSPLAKREAAMRVAYEKGIYERLHPVEHRFLVALAIEGNTNQATKTVGISSAARAPIIEKLLDLGLMNAPINPSEDYYLLPEVKELFLREHKNHRIQSVVRKPMRRLFNVLRNKHSNVFPEIPLCVFIEKSAVKHLLATSSDEFLFLTSRIDFLICNEEMVPELAVEYHGGYHENADVKRRDQLKEKLLAEVGIPLRKIVSGDKVDDLGIDWPKLQTTVHQIGQATHEKILLSERISEAQGTFIASVLYPMTWSYYVGEYVALLKISDRQIKKVFLSQIVNRTPDRKRAELVYRAHDKPDALPIRSTLEIRPGGSAGKAFFYYRKDFDGWKFLFTRMSTK